jgi:hypothetical protein
MEPGAFVSPSYFRGEAKSVASPRSAKFIVPDGLEASRGLASSHSEAAASHKRAADAKGTSWMQGGWQSRRRSLLKHHQQR